MLRVVCIRLSTAPALDCSSSSHRCQHAASAYTGPPSALHVVRTDRPPPPSQGGPRVRSAGPQPRLSLFHPKDKLTNNIANRKLSKVGTELCRELTV